MLPSRGIYFQWRDLTMNSAFCINLHTIIIKVESCSTKHVLFDFTRVILYLTFGTVMEGNAYSQIVCLCVSLNIRHIEK
jgi:hypothetical protein